VREHEGEGQTSRDKETWNLHLSPTVDSDGDGIPDVREIETTHTSPINPDTDGDGIPDGTDLCPTVAAPGSARGCPGPEPPEYGRCIKQATRALTNYDSAKCVKRASEDSGTEAEQLKKGSYQWSSGVAKTKFTTQIKSGTAVTLETVGGTKIACTGETGSGEFLNSKDVGHVAFDLSGCESAGKKCESAGAGAGNVNTSSLRGSIGLETQVVDLTKDHVASELHAESGSVAEFACAGLSVVIRGSVLHKIAANAMKLAAVEKVTAAKGKQKPEHFAGGAPKEHVLEASLNGNTFEQIGWTFTYIVTPEEKMEASTVN
jgi:hypothetical protein